MKGKFSFLYVDTWFDLKNCKFFWKNISCKMMIVLSPIFVADTKITFSSFKRYSENSHPENFHPSNFPLENFSRKIPIRKLPPGIFPPMFLNIPNRVFKVFLFLLLSRSSLTILKRLFFNSMF